jgi:hypothetical protein
VREKEGERERKADVRLTLRVVWSWEANKPAQGCPVSEFGFSRAG